MKRIIPPIAASFEFTDTFLQQFSMHKNSIDLIWNSIKKPMMDPLKRRTLPKNSATMQDLYSYSGVVIVGFGLMGLWSKIEDQRIVG